MFFSSAKYACCVPARLLPVEKSKTATWEKGERVFYLSPARKGGMIIPEGISRVCTHKRDSRLCFVLVRSSVSPCLYAAACHRRVSTPSVFLASSSDYAGAAKSEPILGAVGSALDFGSSPRSRYGDTITRIRNSILADPKTLASLQEPRLRSRAVFSLVGPHKSVPFPPSRFLELSIFRGGLSWVFRRFPW